MKSIATAAWIGLVSSSSAAEAQVSFQRTDYATGGGATWVSVGDVDGDALPDLVVALQEDDALAVLLGTGGGGFTAPILTPTLDGPNSIALGDVDGDGRLDALVGHAGTRRVLVLAGAGDGTFASTNLIQADRDSRTVALTDFDGDGHLDVAVANFDSAKILLAFGDGAGGFGGEQAFPANSGPTHLVVADTDLDGDCDLVASRAAEPYFFWPFVLENLGDRAFAQVPFTSMTGVPVWIAVGDLTGDGWPDLAAPTDDGLDSLLETLDNDFDNTFGTVSLLDLTDRNELGDFDGDGDLDHALRHWSDGVRIWLGDGAAGVTGQAISTGAPQPEHIAVADLDGDGLDDLVTANAGASGISVLVNEFCLGPEVHGVSPASVPNVTLGAPAQVHFSGACLADVDAVRVAGIELTATQFTVVSDAELVVAIPLVPLLGAVPVELSAPSGSARTTVDVVAASPPVLDLEHADPDLLDPRAGATLTLGGAPGNAFVLFASLDAVPSSAPGALELDIGAGFTSLVLLSAALLGPPGWDVQSYPIGNIAPGIQVHLQAAVLASVSAPPPFDATNATSGTVGP